MNRARLPARRRIQKNSAVSLRTVCAHVLDRSAPAAVETKSISLCQACIKNEAYRALFSAGLKIFEAFLKPSRNFSSKSLFP